MGPVLAGLLFLLVPGAAAGDLAGPGAAAGASVAGAAATGPASVRELVSPGVEGRESPAPSATRAKKGRPAGRAKKAVRAAKAREIPAPIAAPTWSFGVFEADFAIPEPPPLLPEVSPVAAEAPAPVPEPDADFERLFGDAEAAASPARAPAPEVPLWVGPVALLGLGLALLFRWRSTRARARPEALWVLGRAAIGKQSSLVLVEVNDVAGGARRFLVGQGGGAPVLLADLAPSAPAAARERPRVDPGALEAAIGRELPPPQAAHPHDLWERTLREAEASEPRLARPGEAPPPRLKALPDGLESRDDLIAEVLAERTRERRTGGRRTGRGLVA